MEPGWNPMLERQALDRIHRLGQTKDVVSRSYVVEGPDSIEAVKLTSFVLQFILMTNLNFVLVNIAEAAD
jgi:hypothetical protein